jgi:hypothetical protein
VLEDVVVEPLGLALSHTHAHLRTSVDREAESPRRDPRFREEGWQRRHLPLDLGLDLQAPSSRKLTDKTREIVVDVETPGAVGVQTVET